MHAKVDTQIDNIYFDMKGIDVKEVLVNGDIAVS